MSIPCLPTRQIGDFLVSALSDGTMSASLDLLSGIETAEAAAIQDNAQIAEPGNIHINGYLIQGRGAPFWSMRVQEASITSAGSLESGCCGHQPG